MKWMKLLDEETLRARVFIIEIRLHRTQSQDPYYKNKCHKYKKKNLLLFFFFVVVALQEGPWGSVQVSLGQWDDDVPYEGKIHVILTNMLFMLNSLGEKFKCWILVSIVFQLQSEIKSYLMCAHWQTALLVPDDCPRWHWKRFSGARWTDKSIDSVFEMRVSMRSVWL